MIPINKFVIVEIFREKGIKKIWLGQISQYNDVPVKIEVRIIIKMGISIYLFECSVKSGLDFRLIFKENKHIRIE